MNTAVSIRTFLAIALLGALASAQAAPITFDSLTGTVTPNGSIKFTGPVVTDGFSFSTLPIATLTPDFGTWTPASNANATSSIFSNFTGSNSLFSNTGQATTVVAVGGGAFDVLSIDIGFVYLQTNNNGSQLVTFTGTKPGGPVTQNFTIPGGSALNTVTLVGFTGLSAFQISNQTNAFQFDNVNVQAVPEPASMTVLGVGALALLGRRRKALRTTS